MQNSFQNPDDFLIAKDVCQGTLNTVEALAIFNRLYKKLSKYISSKYRIASDHEAEINESSSLYKIILDFPNCEDGERFSEVSIGEFILETLKRWNPEKANYLSYVEYMLGKIGFHRVPVPTTIDQYKGMKWVNGIKKDLESRIGEKITMMDIPNLLDGINNISAKRFAINYIINKPIELDKPILTCDSDESFSLIDIISSEDSLEDSVTTSSFELLDQIYEIFVGEQERTQKIISIYLVSEVFAAYFHVLSSSDLFELNKRYPKLFLEEHIIWLQDEFERINLGCDENNHFISMVEQAKHLGISYEAYKNVISRFRKKLKEKVR